MRSQVKLFFATLFAITALASGPDANARVTVKVLGAGSSAMWQEFALAAANSPTLSGPGSHHWTTKGKCPDSSNCAQAYDVRTGVNHAEVGNLWVVWNKAKTEVWAYLSIDSVVGNRAFFSAPRAQLQIDGNAENSNSGLNLIAFNLFKYGDPGNCGPNGGQESTCDASSLPSAIYSALNNAGVTAAFSTLRPEDALFAQVRTNSALTANLSGLGYTGTPLGIPVESAWTSSTATPDIYAISGTDPVTGAPIPHYALFDVGAAVETVAVNRKDANGLGSGITDVSQSQLQALFTGTTCNLSVFSGNSSIGVFPLLREPLAGEMNVFEFTNLTDPISFVNSQETNVGQPTPGTSANPLNQQCLTGPGSRYRGIGTGEIVSGNGKGTGGILNTDDSIGYVAFSYGNVAPLADSTSYGYLTLAGVDPLVGQPGYVQGEYPVCNAPCPARPGTTFKHLRDGTYRSWEVLRAITDSSGPNFTNLKVLVTAAQDNINKYVPDFVPFKASTGDPGLRLYRSHFSNTYTKGKPNNGLGQAPENGGDVGGCIKKKGPPPGILNAHENTGKCSL
jgi:hypothetical protein